MWRAALVALLLLAAWSGLGLHLAHLHLSPDNDQQERVRRMHLYEEQILVGRGRIFDRNERLMALDLPVKDIWVDPVVILSNGHARAASEHLARILKLPKAQVYDRINRPGRRYEPIARRAREEVAADVMRLRIPGVHVSGLTTRFYPHDQLGCHVLGYSNHEGQGSAGIEQRWDSLLRGRPGYRQSERDGAKREIMTRRSIEIAPQEGADIYLTLDENIQFFTEKALDAAMTNFNPSAAWAIVESVRTGEILAMASRPAYDLNQFNKTTADTRLNRAVGINYEPGSVFKVGVVAAALNEGLIATNQLFDCENGMWYYAGRPLRDFHPYGILDVTGILRKSSNIGAAKIAILLGEERLYRYLKNFGLGTPTGLEVPGEEPGLLHPVRRWSNLSITRIAMGHEVAVTAMQMLNVLCCLGNDGFLMQPYLVSKVVDKNGVTLQENKPRAVARPVSERTAILMRKMLTEVTLTGGTGTRAAIPGYLVAGKTGTAEKIVDGRYSKTENVSSFVGMFPADKPEIGIIVVLDNPHPLRTGGVTAGPVFAEIAAPIARYMDIPSMDAEDWVYYEPTQAEAP